ncbi:MAG TPA: alpha/beta fold hydrolase [Pilimelia sp.]|nr:alpha/beta fold hydrolase [Pilimelia sp.]
MPAMYESLTVPRGEDRLAVRCYADPADAPDAPVAVVWPAMGVPAGYYGPFAAALRERGMGVAVVDLRGTGDSTPRPGRASRYGYRELAGDVGVVLDVLKPRLGDRRRVLVGHSLGGQACLLHLAHTGDTSVDGLALVAVGVPYWRLYGRPRRYGVLPVTQAIGAAAGVLGVWPGWGFGGRQARGVMRDWARTARTGRLPGWDGVDPAVALRRLTTPVLAVSVDDDTFTPAPTVDHLCAMLPPGLVRREHYTAAAAGARLDHFRWARAAGPLAARIARFAGAPADGPETARGPAGADAAGPRIVEE